MDSEDPEESVISLCGPPETVIPRVLIYSATAGYRHDSIPTAIAVLKELGSQQDIEFDDTEDKEQFNDENLARYDALLFLSNSDEVLDESGKTAFLNYLEKGGNYIGIHAASACLFTTEFYQKTVGALFENHPDIGSAVVLVEDPSHPSTSMLPDRWPVTDEMYNFRSDPRDVGATLLLSVDETSYVDNNRTEPDPQGKPHPIAWCQDHLAGVDGSKGPIGRSWYTSLGHLTETWQEPTFLDHIMGGITWALASNTTRAFNSEGLVGNAAPVQSEPIGNSASSETSDAGLSKAETASAGVAAAAALAVGLAVA